MFLLFLKTLFLHFYQPEMVDIMIFELGDLDTGLDSAIYDVKPW